MFIYTCKYAHINVCILNRPLLLESGGEVGPAQYGPMGEDPYNVCQSFIYVSFRRRLTTSLTIYQ